MNATQFCKLVEQRLGWEVSAGPDWKKYMTEASKVERKRATNPSLYTWENLRLAVELLAREKTSRSPVGVLSHVDRALDLALDTEHDVETEIRKVIAYEVGRGDPNGWEQRFARTDGPYRQEALNEWKWGVK